ncbi:MAG TPA: hypothetical protein VGK53_23155 [Propionicimonas sp.]|jgi:hypothetical protein
MTRVLVPCVLIAGLLVGRAGDDPRRHHRSCGDVARVAGQDVLLARNAARPAAELP